MLLLACSFTLIFIWQSTPLQNYAIPFLGFLIFVFLILSIEKKGFNPHRLLGEEGTGAVFILNTLVFLLIFSTGALSSTLFFLLYFLGFSIAFVFTPTIVFVFIIGTIAVFLPEAIKGDVLGNFLKIGSLFIVFPLAYFFGREFRKEEKK